MGVILADKKRPSLCPACISKCLYKYWIEISICVVSDIAQQRDCQLSIENVGVCGLLNCNTSFTSQSWFESGENRNESYHCFLHLETFAESLDLNLHRANNCSLRDTRSCQSFVGCSFDVFPSSVNKHEAPNANWIPLPSEAPQQGSRLPAQDDRWWRIWTLNQRCGEA